VAGRLQEAPRPDVSRASSVAEQRHDRGGRLVGDRQRLDGQLLLGLQRLEPGRGLFHVGIDQRTDARGREIREFANEVVLDLQPLLRGAEGRGGIDGRGEQRLDVVETSIAVSAAIPPPEAGVPPVKDEAVTSIVCAAARLLRNWISLPTWVTV
jgi:hypothetical protein